MVKAKTATPQVAVSSSITHWEAIRQALLRLEREGYSPRLLPVLEEVGVGPELPPLWWERLKQSLDTLEALGFRSCLLYAYHDPEEGERVVDLEGLLRKASSLGEAGLEASPLLGEEGDRPAQWEGLGEGQRVEPFFLLLGLLLLFANTALEWLRGKG